MFFSSYHKHLEINFPLTHLSLKQGKTTKAACIYLHLKKKKKCNAAIGPGHGPDIIVEHVGSVHLNYRAVPLSGGPFVTCNSL